MVGALQDDLTRKRILRNVREATEELLHEFHDDLAFDNWRSPDQFLGKRPEYADVGKFLILSLLKQYENPSLIASDAGWYEHLRDALDVATIEELQALQLSVVTFNYDRSLDFFLHKYVKHRFRLTADEAWEAVQRAIPIVHVHGTLGPYPSNEYRDNTALLSLADARAIKIVSEVDENSDEFQIATRLLNGAERVVVFGFGFGTDNVRRLKYFRQITEESAFVEDRDVRIAFGSRAGSQNKQEASRWLMQWGLVNERHFWMLDCNRYFQYQANPFV
ncbi:MAG TPA: SIR2 family protein [Pirellulaceae bacterium]|jgi:hypothetical protein|nr:SIR2 family protein [Pirellulaceae bacterium]